MPGKILVLGAAGHVGAPLVTELLAAKEQVEVLRRALDARDMRERKRPSHQDRYVCPLE